MDGLQGKTAAWDVTYALFHGKSDEYISLEEGATARKLGVTVRYNTSKHMAVFRSRKHRSRTNAKQRK
jgi:hypothetical protein